MAQAPAMVWNALAEQEPHSPSDSADNSKKHRSRDAAREYRKRKKKDLEDMEVKLQALMAENAQLRIRGATDALPPAAVAAPPPPARNALRDEWRRLMVELETLLAALTPDLAQVEITVNLVFIVGRQLLQSFKQQQEIDFVAFATHACFCSPQSNTEGTPQLNTYYSAYWLELTRDLELSAEMRAKADTALREYAEDIKRLKQEQNMMTADLAQHLRANTAQLYVGIDAASVHPYAARMGHLQRNYEAHWQTWDRTMTALSGCFTPMQRAQVLLRKKAFLENAGFLNEIWHALCRRPPLASYREWEPSLSSLVPLPFHMCHTSVTA